MEPQHRFDGRVDDTKGRRVLVVISIALAVVVGLGLLDDDQGADGARSAPVRAAPPAPPAPPATLSQPARAPAFAASIQVLHRNEDLVPGIVYSTWARSLRLSIRVPTAGWWHGEGSSITRTASAASGAEADILWATAPGGRLLPCHAELDATASSAAIAQAVATASGVDVISGPSRRTIAGSPARQVIVRVRSREDCGDDPPSLMPGDLVRVWVVDLGTRPLIIEAATRADARPAVDEEIDSIIDGLEIGLRPEGSDPFETAIVPERGRLEPGWYLADVASHASDPPDEQRFALSFLLETAGWRRGNRSETDGLTILRGASGTPERAVIRFGSPDEVAVDPCASPTSSAPVGASVAALADAMARIPHLDVTGPSEVRLRWSTARFLELRVPPDIACGGGEVHLWTDDVGGARTAAPGARIRVWIFNPNDRELFGRVVVEAETAPGASAALEDEILWIVESITHGG